MYATTGVQRKRERFIEGFEGFERFELFEEFDGSKSSTGFRML